MADALSHALIESELIDAVSEEQPTHRQSTIPNANHRPTDSHKRDLSLSNSVEGRTAKRKKSLENDGLPAADSRNNEFSQAQQTQISLHALETSDSHSSSVTSNDKSLAQKLLRQALGNPDADFRDGQWEAIDGIVNNNQRLLVIQRTGWGKSLVYFISTRILRDQKKGPTLIICPLLALMRNQQEAAKKFNVKAVVFDSTNYGDHDSLAVSVKNDECDVIIISPERLNNSHFKDNIWSFLYKRIGLFVVDEAHCISTWGHDFRPEYRRIKMHLSDLLRAVPKLPVLATTATANKATEDDIKGQLILDVVHRGGMARDNLELHTVNLPLPARLTWIANKIKFLQGSGIIYTLTKKDAEKVTNYLVEKGINAKAYYSNVKGPNGKNPSDYRRTLEDQLMKDEVKVLVATTALGMGFDKPNIGFVIHFQAPESITAYYQQVGRAGRSIPHAVGILLYGVEDDEIHKFFANNSLPRDEDIELILAELEDDELTEEELQERCNIRPGDITKVLKFLESEENPMVSRNNKKWSITVRPLVNDDEQRLQQRRLKLAPRHEKEFAKVKEYTNLSSETDCLMSFIRKELGDEPGTTVCQMCANCMKVDIQEYSKTSDEDLEEAVSFTKRYELAIDCKRVIPTGIFEKYRFEGSNAKFGNYKYIINHLQAEEGRVLALWNDGVLGNMVKEDKEKSKEDKENSFFRDELVIAMYEMVVERWNLNPYPQWLTCIPSLNHKSLVPNFARRIADRLGLPFVPIVEKLKSNGLQKMQKNTPHKCRNLDGAFGISPMYSMPSGPVFLVDDIVDSAWTMTVVAALLKQNESGPVYPLALASLGYNN